MLDEMDKMLMHAGITEYERQTKTYQSIKKALQNNPEIIIGETLGDAMKQAWSLANELKTKSADAIMRYISDKDIRDAVAAYTATLTTTQDVFGEENMTEAVICKAIEAGSYIAYRAIMGEAQQPVKRY